MLMVSPPPLSFEMSKIKLNEVPKIVWNWSPHPWQMSKLKLKKVAQKVPQKLWIWFGPHPSLLQTISKVKLLFYVGASPFPLFGLVSPSYG